MPNSLAAKRKPFFMRQMDTAVGMLSKYLIVSSVATVPSYANVTRYKSPYSLCVQTCVIALHVTTNLLF